MIASLMLTGGCLSSATDPDGKVAVAGNWQYSAQHSSGGLGTSTGTLVINSQSQTAYTGTFDVTENIVGTNSRRVAGPITGRLASGASVDFSVTLGAVRRQHVGTLRADTIAGTWFELNASGSIAAGGSYRAIRSR